MNSYLQTLPSAATAPSAAGGASAEYRVRTCDDDPPGLQVKVETILREWINMSMTGAAAKDPALALRNIVNMVCS